jgi:predicted RNase H-like nuclease (RuvC/YqgF family)
MSDALLMFMAAAIGAALSAVVVALGNRNKTKAEATDLIGQSWERVIERLEAIIIRLETEKQSEEQRADTLRLKVLELAEEIESLKDEVRRLRRLLITSGIDPVDPDHMEPGL